MILYVWGHISAAIEIKMLLDFTTWRDETLFVIFNSYLLSKMILYYIQSYGRQSFRTRIWRFKLSDLFY